MKYFVTYKERRENALTHFVNKVWSELEKAIEYAYRFDWNKFQVQVLTENHEIVKEF